MKANIFACLIVGSRSFNCYELFESEVDFLLQNIKEKIIIVSGEASGTDTLAKQYAKNKGYEYQGFPAQWDLYGPSAGYKRNEQMHQYISMYERRGCIAFWDGKSRCTQHSFELAKKYNNPIKVIHVSGE